MFLIFTDFNHLRYYKTLAQDLIKMLVELLLSSTVIPDFSGLPARLRQFRPYPSNNNQLIKLKIPKAKLNKCF